MASLKNDTGQVETRGFDGGNPHTMNRSSLLIAEVATVTALFATALLFARPQLEGWTIMNEFRTVGVRAGVAYYWSVAPTRWFEPIPLAAAWLLGHGRGWSIGAVYGAELIAKYAIIRLGLARRATGDSLWLLATLAAVMPPWLGEWREHNMAQQLAAVFMLAGFSFLVRGLDGRRKIHALGAALGVLLSLVTYEGLAVCSLVMPIAVAAMGARSTVRSFVAQVVRSSIPVASALAAFAMISFVLLRGNASSYQAQTFQGQAIADHAMARLVQLYTTSYVNHPLALPSLIVLLALGAAFSRMNKVLVVAILAALPLLALPYAVSMYALTDPERVTFPLAFGFFLVFAAVQSEDVRLAEARAWAVAGLVTFAAINAYAAYRPYLLQRSVTDQIQRIAFENPAQPIRVRDWSGKLGDKYTFIYSEALSGALAVLGSPLPITLCTPQGVDPVRPDIERWAAQIPRCNPRPMAVDPIDLDVRGSYEDNAVRVSEHGGVLPVDGIDLWVSDGTISGKEGKIWWIDEAHAVIEIHNTTDHAVTASWHAFFYPPPCAAKASFDMTGMDGEHEVIDLKAPVQRRFTTILAPRQTKMQVVDVTSPVCHLPGGDSRPFYAGIVDLHVDSVANGSE